MKTTLNILIGIFLGLLVAGSASAQVPLAKHPRVQELEKELSRSGLDMLRGRFPGHPFMLTVAIDPMMRERSSGSSEKLPSYDAVDDEIVDEWDDPAVPMTSLMARVRKVQVNVSIPAQLSDDEVAELRSALISSLNLIEARDVVDMRKRNWSMMTDSRRDQGELLVNVLLSGLGLALVMVCFYGLAWFSTERLGKAYREAAQLQKSPSSSGPTPTETPESNRGGSSPQGDVRFNDPIRTRETIAAAIRLLEEHGSFPSLEDLMVMDRAVREDSGLVGALMSEFSPAVRQRIFSLTSCREWLDALSEPGEVSLGCVDILHKCLRLQRSDADRSWQELLTLTWRLDSKIKDFLSGLPQKEAFALLSCLPKAVSIPAAREVYPGAWASLLDTNAVFDRPNADRIEHLKAKALQTLPLRGTQTIEKYRREKELIGFLRVADPVVEKEIYTTAGHDSFLYEMRPPFFHVFDAEAADLEQLVPRIRIDDWALAMFNISRLERKNVERLFAEKQRIRYFELLKSFDGNGPDRMVCGEARERVGRALRQIQDARTKTNVVELKEAA